MQALGRSCSRMGYLVSQSAVENQLLFSQAQASTNNGLCSCSHLAATFVPNFLPSLTAWLPSNGRPYTSSAVVQQNQIDPETKAAWPQLTHHQKKELLKPDKNRNHFKRMWKKDLQIKHAHQTRKRQQAAADAQRLKSTHERWRQGAARWQGEAGIPAVTDIAQ